MNSCVVYKAILEYLRLFWHERSAFQSPFFPHFSPSLSTFLIDLVLGSKIYFAKNLDQTPSKTLLAIFGALVVIFDFAGVAALQAVSKSPRRRTMILNDPKTAKTPKNEFFR